MDTYTKTCSRCGETKSCDDFNNRKESPDGKQHHCRSCQNEYKRQIKARGLPASDPRHGTVNGYAHYGCRCNLCRDAWRIYKIDRRSNGLPDGDPKHGTVNGYEQWGCRCVLCANAASSDGRRRKYGLTLEQEQQFLDATACSLCGGLFDDSIKSLSKVVDHCHETGRVRGHLHGGCNTMIGIPKGTTTAEVAARFEQAGLTRHAAYLRGTG